MSIDKPNCWRISSVLDMSISSCSIGNKIACLSLFRGDKCKGGHTISL
jgi:hypothetical protein